MNSNTATLDANQASLCALKQASLCALKQSSLCALVNDSDQELRPTVNLALENLLELVSTVK